MTPAFGSLVDNLVARTSVVDMAEVADVDLVALLIAGGTGSRDPARVAAEMLAGTNNDLGKLTRGDVLDTADLSPLARVRLLALREVYRRASLRQAAVERARVLGPEAAEAYLRPLLGDDVEHVAVLYLDRQGNVIRAGRSTTGAVDHSIFDVPGILRDALLCRATNLIVAHNHPSNDGAPSSDDIRVTRRMKEAAKSVGIELNDHLIFTRHGVTSMTMLGLP